MVSRRKVHAGFGRSIVAAAVFMFLASCTPAVFDYEVFDTSGTADALGRREEDVDALVKEGLVRFVLNPVAADDGYLFGERGVLGEPVEAQSGERLEIRWEGFFPRYRLYYVPSPRHPGVVIGECYFPDGCNNGFFFAPDADGDAVPDRLRYVQWVSSDYGRDDGVPGYLDRYRYVYDVAKDRLYVWHDLLFYRCPPPLSTPPYTCRTKCDPPCKMSAVGNRTYPVVFKTRLVEERSLLGPQE